MGRDRASAVHDPTAVRAPKPSIGFYDFDEYERLLEVAKELGPDVHLVVLLGGEAGLRCGEMIGLEWDHVDLGEAPDVRPAIGMARTCHGAEGGPAAIRAVDRTSRLGATGPSSSARASECSVWMMAPRSRRTSSAEYVRKAGRKAGVPASGAHGLRHTFCSHLAMRGAPARAIQELAGHQDLTTTQRYMHLSPAALEGAIRLLEQGGPPKGGPHVQDGPPEGGPHVRDEWRHSGDEATANR